MSSSGAARSRESSNVMGADHYPLSLHPFPSSRYFPITKGLTLETLRQFELAN
jgi:hypothetical protein